MSVQIVRYINLIKYLCTKLPLVLALLLSPFLNAKNLCATVENLQPDFEKITILVLDGDGIWLI